MLYSFILYFRILIIKFAESDPIKFKQYQRVNNKVIKVGFI